MKPIVITCRKNEIYRIRIRCRCGNSFITEIPHQVARALSLHPCPGCGVGFGVSLQQDGKWKIERLSEVQDMTFVQDGQGPNGEPSGGEEERTSYIGLRIKIVKASGTPVLGTVAMDPHPEHIGKFGTIIGEDKVGSYVTPRIKLDDGTVLTGAECWWEPVPM